jgi:hypothetical protein
MPIRPIRFHFKKWLLVTPLIAGCAGGPLSTPCPTQTQSFAAKVPTDGGPTPTDCNTICAENLFVPSSFIESCTSITIDGGPGATCTFTTPCHTGRRPEGLAELHRAQGPEVLGHYWATVAQLEAASVNAFERLSRELFAHRAPDRLVKAAQRAARDEVRHARLTTRLAERHGVKVSEITVGPLPVRELEAVAAENIAEGCVRETYGVLVALWQARASAQHQVRSTLARIARDEASHARLSWEVAAWAERSLSQEAQARLRHVRDDAVATLKQEASVEPDALCVTQAGVPEAARALAWVAQLERELWN